MVGIFVFLCVGFLLPKPAQTLTDRCSFWPGAGFQNGKCLLVFSDEWKSTIEDAKIVCIARGGRIAEVKTQSEADGFNLFLDNVGFVNIWIGASYLDAKDASTSSYVWLSDQETINDVLWGDGNPSEPGTLNCVQYDRRRNRRPLHTKNCDETDEFVCERDPSWNDPCAEQFPGSTHILGQCFTYFYTNKTWEAAVEHCQGMGGFLAEPRVNYSRDVFHHFLLSKIDKFPVTVWLGARFDDSNKAYEWISTEEILSSELQVPWVSGRSNGGEFLSVLVEDASPSNIVWTDEPGIKSSPYVCQSEAPIPTTFTYVVVFPQIGSTSLDEAKVIHVTSGSASRPVNLTLVQSTSAGTQKITTDVVYREMGVVFTLEPDLAFDATGLYRKYAEVQATDHVTVVFFYRGRTGSGSTLILANEILAGSTGWGLVHFVISPDSKGSQLAIVALKNDATEVTVYFRQPSESLWLQINAIKLSGIEVARATLGSQYETLYLNGMGGSGETIVVSSKPVAVFSGSLKEEGVIGNDFVLERILPIEFLGSEYVTFPTPPTDSYKEDLFVISSVYEKTVLEVTQNGATGEIILSSPGEVEVVSLSNQGFHWLRGNQPFYLYKYSGFQVKRENDSYSFETSDASCVTSILPAYLWRLHYDVQMTSSILVYDIYIMLVLPTSFKETFLVNGISEVNLGCKEIKDTELSGCSYKVPDTNTSYLEIHLLNYQSTFGAYMYAKSSTSSFCHALGVRGTAQLNNVVDYESYQPSLVDLMTAESPCKTPEPQNITEIPDSMVSTDATIDDTTIFDSTTSYINEFTTSTFTTDPIDVLVVQPFVTNITAEEINRLTEKIKRHLHVQPETTSAYNRKKISVPDKRFSAQTIGGLGIVILISLLLLVVILDCINLFRDCPSTCKTR